MSTRKPMSYYGGKSGLIAEITAQFPNEIESYIEPFCGSATIFFAAPGRWAPNEILNDLNGDLVAFLKALRDHPAALIKRLSLTPFSRQIYNEAHRALQEKTYKDEVDRGLAFFVTVAQSFSSTGQVNSWRLPVGCASASEWKNRIDSLSAASSRLMQASIENYPALKVMKTYDRPKTLFYLDPPYLSVNFPKDKTAAYRGFDMQEKEHEVFIEACLRLRGYAIISGYDHPLYKILEAGSWERIEIPYRTIVVNRANHKADQARTEILWINPQLQEKRRQQKLF